jgi:thiol-disulfide isomerase/thioredoxin
MKRIYFQFLLLMMAVGASAQYKVTLHTPSYKSGLAYFTYYYGKNINIQDSGWINDKGVVVFKRDSSKLPPGIYSIIFPGKNRMVDFIVDKEQVFDITADTTDLVNKTEFKGLKENELFKQYQKYTAEVGRQLNAEQMAYQAAKSKADSQLHEKKYQELDKKLQEYRETIIEKSPTSMLATLFQAMKPAPVLMQKPVTKEDSLANYNYYKKHYWDGITFMDDRVIRTPFFLPKVERFFRDVVVQAPDSIIKEADYLLLFARNNTEMHKFLLNWLTDEYIYPKYMGQDAVFVHLFEKYHSKGVSTWLNEKQIKTISDRAYMVMLNLLGSKAADLNLLDTSGKPARLYDLNAEYTLVVFWDPNCGHCKVEIPKIDSVYKAKWKKQGLKIFAVLTENDRAKWKEFIRQHDLAGWVHAYQTEEQRKAEADANQPGFRQLYDVTQTPTIYLLDKDKRIIAKKLTYQQLDDMLQVKIKSKAPGKSS